MSIEIVQLCSPQTTWVLIQHVNLSNKLQKKYLIFDCNRLSWFVLLPALVLALALRKLPCESSGGGCSACRWWLVPLAGLGESSDLEKTLDVAKGGKHNLVWGHLKTCLDRFLGLSVKSKQSWFHDRRTVFVAGERRVCDLTRAQCSAVYRAVSSVSARGTCCFTLQQKPGLEPWEVWEVVYSIRLVVAGLQSQAKENWILLSLKSLIFAKKCHCKNIFFLVGECILPDWLCG